MSTSRPRLWILLAFAVVIVAAVALRRILAPEHRGWLVALPWIVLVLFWIYLVVMSRRDRRGRPD